MGDASDEVEESKNPLTEPFNAFVESTLDFWKIPGLSLAVIDREDTYTKGYGYASLPSTPVTPTTNFYTGSTTKAFTAAALAILVEDNKNYPGIQWTTPVCQNLREDFVLEDPWATEYITIEDILSHRTGLPGHDRCYGPVSAEAPKEWDKPRPDVRAVVRQLRYLPMTAEPRTEYQYCNVMFTVAGHIVETVTGKWLGTFLKEQIWQPLGMKGTFFSPEEARESKDYDLAKGYLFDEDKKEFKHVDWIDLEACAGAGAVISNVVDYAKWAKAVMDQNGPLKAKTWRQMLTPRTLMGEQEPYTGSSSYALGWGIGVYQGEVYWQHSGGVNAFGALLIILPRIKYAVVAFANTAGSGNFAELAILFELIDDKLGVPEKKRFDWNKRNKQVIEDGKEHSAKWKQRFFPNLPSPALPLRLPLTSYAGTYTHPGYKTLTIYLDQKTSTLRADRRSTWQEHLSFEHASGDFFVVRSDWEGDFAAWWPDTYPAEFRIGADGKVSEVGIGWEPAMAGKMIWLNRAI